MLLCVSRALPGSGQRGQQGGTVAPPDFYVGSLSRLATRVQQTRNLLAGTPGNPESGVEKPGRGALSGDLLLPAPAEAPALLRPTLPDTRTAAQARRTYSVPGEAVGCAS